MNIDDIRQLLFRAVNDYAALIYSELGKKLTVEEANFLSGRISAIRDCYSIIDENLELLIKGKRSLFRENGETVLFNEETREKTHL